MRAFAWLLIGSLLPCGLALAVSQPEGPRPDPFPMRRIQIGPERVTAELERAQKGVLHILPRIDFEAKVQKAALALELAAAPPRLTRTRYSARIVEQGLVGSAEWSVVHTASGPGILPLPDFNLALGKRLMVGAGAGILADLDGKAPGLWIDKPGQPTVSFDWSRRGKPSADGLHFDLLLPACANAQLELKLPGDYHLLASKPGLQVEGPRASLPLGHGEAKVGAGERIWTISFSGKSRLEFVLRRVETSNALLLASVQTRQEIGPDRVLADYDFQIEALHGTVSQLVFDGDVPLQPYDVTLGGVEVKDWEWQPIPAGQGSAGGVLVVPLREPLYGVLPGVRVRCLAPPAKDKKDQLWVSPGLRLRGAVARGENLRLHALAEAHLEDWKCGQFLLRKSIAEADGSQVLMLVHDGAPLPRGPASAKGIAAVGAAGKGVGAEGNPIKRPSAVLKARSPELLLDQQSWWQLDVQGSTLTSELMCKMNRGQLYHLPLRLPADSQVEQFSAEPKERGWAASGSRKEPILLIDLAQPLTPRTPLKIKLKLRLPPASAPKKGALTQAIPDIVPLLPSLREGGLAVRVDPRWRAEVVQSSWPATAAPEGPAEGPWRATTPDYYFAFRGTPLSGQLRLFPRDPQFQARCQSDVFLGDERGAVVTRLTVEPLSGSLDHIDLLVSAPLAEKWKVRGEAGGVRVASVQRLIGAEVTAEAAQQPNVQQWRLRFAEPLRSKVTLVLEAGIEPVGALAEAVGKGEHTWAIPVVAVFGADQFDGELAVQLAGAEIIAAEVELLQEMQRPPVPASPAGKGKAGSAAMPRGAQPLWRIYRYDTPPPVKRLPRLQVKARPAAAQSVARESCDLAALTTYIEPGGRLLHQFQFRLINWRKNDVAVILPAGAQVLAARVEGRWLPSVPQHAVQDGVQLDLPASAALALQHFDIYYATPEGGSTWSPWQTLAAPLPGLPVGPLDVRQSWVLPPGVAPLGPSWQRLAGSPTAWGAPDWPQLGKQTWQAGQPLLAALAPEFATPAWAGLQKKQLVAAEAALRRRFGPETGWVLGSVLEHLALISLPEDGNEAPLVIDAAALAEAGLTPQSAFAKGGDAIGGDPWTRLRLVVRPTPGGLLLTTRQQWQRWADSGESEMAGEGPLADAVAEAGQRGQNSTGRFWAAAFWLEKWPMNAANQHRGMLRLDSFGPDWTRWEAAAAADTRTTMVVVRPFAIHVVGVALACLLALAWHFAAGSVQTVQGRRRRGRFLILWAALALVTVLWLPASLRGLALWPAATAMTLGLATHVIGILRGRAAPVRSGPSKVPAAAAAALFLALAGAVTGLLPAWSQGTDPSTILVLPATAGAAEQVLVPPDVLKRLDNLMQRGPSHQRGAVLLAAQYDGTLTGETALFKVDYQVYSFSDNAMLTIPLLGVELREGATLDGVAAQPAAAPTGFAVNVKEKGPHKLTLLFTVRMAPAPSTGPGQGAGNRDLQFTVPRLFQNKLQLRLPIALPQPQAMTGLGAAETATFDAQTQQVTLELGRESAVHLRWAKGGTAPTAGRATVQEAYYWDLRSPGSACTAVLNYTVKGGSVTEFKVALGDTLEPRGVEVSGDAPGGDETARPRLRDWRFAFEDGQWRLVVQLQAPASGTVLVTLHLVPRQALGAGTVRLELPEPLGVKSTGGLVAYRVEGLEAVENPFNMSTVLLAGEQFAKQWLAGGAHEAAVPTRAFSFRNYKSGGALLVTLTPWRPALEQDLRWTLQPGRADLLATLKFAGGAEDLLLVEWDVPAQVTLADIAGDNVRSWTRVANSGRLQLWLKQPARNLVITARGWTMYNKAATGQVQRWALPLLGSAHAISTATIVRVVDGAGIHAVLDPRTLVNLTSVPLAAAPTWVLQGPALGYQAEFTLQPVPLQTRLVGVTTVEARGGMLHLAGQWHVHVPQSGPAEFHVYVADWSGPPLKLEGPRDLTVSEMASPAGQQHWKVLVPANAPRRVQLKLTGARACQTGTVVTLPTFRLENALWDGQWLAARSPGLDLQSAVGLAAVKDVVGEPGMPPGVADRLGQRTRVWKAVSADWKLALIARAPAAQTGLEVLLAEQEVAFGEGFGWIHQATLWVHVSDSSELAIDMPPGARLLGASVNGDQINPRPISADRLAVVLPPGEGLHRLRLRWAFSPETEPLSQPMLIAPRLEGMQALVFNWTLTLPPGFRLDLGQGNLGHAPTLELARHEIAKAEARKSATLLLLEQYQKAPEETLKSKILLSQQAFVRHCRLAAKALEIGALGTLAPDQETGSADLRAELKVQLVELERQNAAAVKAVGTDKWRLPEDKFGQFANKMQQGDWYPGRGMIIRWRGGAQAQLPGGMLIGIDNDSRNQAGLATGGVLFAALVLLALSFFNAGPAWMQRLWPEQIAALALAGWALWGFSLVGGILLLLAIASRLVLVIGRWHQWRQPRQPAEQASQLSAI